ncbi:MAG: type II toxin-antitoxin system VapC family toxin [Chlamydiota bacterium]
MIVADTCLIFHLFNETLLTLSAQEIFAKDPYWIMPSLWKEEYANILSKLARKEFRQLDEVIHHFNYTVEGLKNCERSIEAQKALKISIESKISVYDAHFIALAMDFDTVVVTEDKEILKNCPDLAISLHGFLKKI